MAVTREQFYDWVRQAEEQATRNPAGYRRKVGLFAFLGYAYVFLLLGLVVATIALLTVIALYKDTAGGDAGLFKIGLIAVFFGWALVSALWVTFDAPQGRRITRQQFPKLFAEIDDLQKKLDTIPIHEVILVPEFNAFVAQTPRLGIFGWHKNTLGLGLDLMMVLTPEEMRSVIAHELGHLSGNHSRFAGRIYRVRKTWSNLFERFNEKGGWGSSLINRFFRWYVPRFDAYSFALRRQNEYEADAAAAYLTSAEAAGQALKKVGLFSRYLNGQYWDEFFAQADHVPAPQRMAYASLAETLPRLDFDRDGLSRFEAASLGRTTDLDDTHPCIRDRLNALGIRQHEIEPTALDLANTAARAWLGKELPALIADHDRDWWQSVGEGWKARHEQVREETAELERLRAKPLEALEQLELWQLGVLTARHGNDADAVAIMRAYQARYPDDWDCAFVLGRLLARTDSPACIVEWRKVPLEHDAYVSANIEAAEFLERHGHQAEADYFHRLAEKRHAVLTAAAEEQNNVTADDELVAPNLSQGNKDHILACLKRAGAVSAAWVAEKRPKFKQAMPIYVIAYKTRLIDVTRWTKLDPDEATMQKVLGAFAGSSTKDDPMNVFAVLYVRLRASKLARKVKKTGLRIL